MRIQLPNKLRQELHRPKAELNHLMLHGEHPNVRLEKISINTIFPVFVFCLLVSYTNFCVCKKINAFNGMCLLQVEVKFQV